MPYLLDADWTIDALQRKRGAHETLATLSQEGIAISWVTVGEVYEGAFGNPEPQRHLASLREFLAPIDKLNLGDAIMERFAENRAMLRREGRLIPDTDILLGVTAVHHDMTVLSRNIRHLSRIPGIKIYSANEE